MFDDLKKIILGGVGVGIALIFVTLNSLGLVDISPVFVGVFATGFVLSYRFLLWALSGNNHKDDTEHKEIITKTAKSEPIRLTLLSEDGQYRYFQEVKKITPRELVILAHGVINQDKSLGYRHWTEGKKPKFSRKRFAQIRREGERLNWWKPKSDNSLNCGYELTRLGEAVPTHFAGMANRFISVRRPTHTTHNTHTQF